MGPPFTDSDLEEPWPIDNFMTCRGLDRNWGLLFGSSWSQAEGLAPYLYFLKLSKGAALLESFAPGGLGRRQSHSDLCQAFLGHLRECFVLSCGFLAHGGDQFGAKPQEYSLSA